MRRARLTPKSAVPRPWDLPGPAMVTVLMIAFPGVRRTVDAPGWVRLRSLAPAHTAAAFISERVNHLAYCPPRLFSAVGVPQRDPNSRVADRAEPIRTRRPLRQLGRGCAVPASRAPGCVARRGRAPGRRRPGRGSRSAYADEGGSRPLPLLDLSVAVERSGCDTSPPPEPTRYSPPTGRSAHESEPRLSRPKRHRRSVQANNAEGRVVVLDVE